MKKKLWLGLVGAAIGVFSAATAFASISRDATGWYVWKKTTFTDGSGRVLRVIDSGSVLQFAWDYVDATGRYGGGDTASGRQLAKSRAIGKAISCAAVFFTHGLFDTRAAGGSYWSYYCGIAPTDPDIRVMANATAYFGFEDIARAQWCSTARSLAGQYGVSGPVYISGDVNLFGDASGTESDVVQSMGSFNSLACY